MITQIEYHLPEKLVTNADLKKENPRWNFDLIESKTGILSRHIAAEDEHASDLAVAAAEKLFAKNPACRDSVDTVIFCSQSPDYLLPTTACILQERLRLSTSTAAFDINLGCSGYIYGLALGASMLRSGVSRKVLFLCAETYSKYIKADDRSARTIFGDAGAATLMEGGAEDASIGPFVLGTDGKGKEKIIVRGYDRQASLSFDGAGVFLFTMQRVPECVRELLAKANKRLEDMDLFVFHQGSKVIIDNIVRILSLEERKVFRGYEKIGNTVSASIPIALKQAEEEKRLRKGDLVMLVGFGVGLSWGSCLIKW